VKNINKTDKHIHSHKKRYLEVISRFTGFKEFNGEKKTATKTSNMFKIALKILYFYCLFHLYEWRFYNKNNGTVDSRYIEFDGTNKLI
jgi:hypothetical protein